MRCCGRLCAPKRAWMAPCASTPITHAWQSKSRLQWQRATSARWWCCRELATFACRNCTHSQTQSLLRNHAPAAPPLSHCDPALPLQSSLQGQARQGGSCRRAILRIGLNRVSKSWRQRQDNHSAVGVGNGGCGPLCARSQVLQDVFFLLEQQGAYCLVAFPAPLVSKLTIRGWGGLV